ncbi:SDR family oxidoreductase [bacterium]|nr:SDR family oxidoreductase [bacterium]
MEPIKNKIVMITGASAGIGEATARLFAESGAKVILIARRKERLFQLSENLKKQFKTESLSLVLDVTNHEEVKKAIGSLKNGWEAIDILINNAGLGKGLDKIHEARPEHWEQMIDTNIKGLLYVSRAVIPGMVARKRGHIINLGSVAGHEVYPGGNVYCATKHAVAALNKGMLMDLVDTPVRVSSIDPGLVETEFSMVRFDGDAERAKKVYDNIRALTSDDIAEIILFAATRPAHVNINEVIVMPTQQASATIVSRSGK